MSSKNLLFVDDEKMVLDGLRRALRPMRKQVVMHFATNGKDALEVMEQEPIDIVISDMRMPGMDGAALLKEAKKRHPETIRIVLTGQSDDEATYRALCVAHQFLMKPCEPAVLKTVIQRACVLHELMTHPMLKRAVSGIDHLPSLPSIYVEIQDRVNDPESSVEDIGKIIEKDLGMSAKVLQLVNSAFFGHYKNIESPSKAVHLLGLNVIKSLVLTLKVFSRYESSELPPKFLEKLWNHSFETAVFARKITETLTDDKELSDNAFTAGLLHDLGKLVLASNAPDKYKKALEIASREKKELRKAEFRVFKASHAEIGGYLLGIWGLPGDVVEALSFHHRPHQYPGSQLAIPAVVACADMLSHELNPEECTGAIPSLEETSLKAVDAAERLQEWRLLCREIKEKGIE